MQLLIQIMFTFTFLVSAISPKRVPLEASNTITIQPGANLSHGLGKEQNNGILLGLPIGHSHQSANSKADFDGESTEELRRLGSLSGDDLGILI